MPETVSFELTDADLEWLRGQASAQIPGNQEQLVAVAGQRLREIEGMLGASAYVPDAVGRFVEELKLLYTMLTDDGFELSDQSKPWILFALGYLANPMDAIPDPVPLVGYLDDVLVIGWVCGMLRGEMKIYKDLRGGG